MRFMFKFIFPTTDESNGWIRDGSIGHKMESILGETQPEAAYFGSVDGNRGGYLVINMDEASEIAAKLEPLLGLERGGRQTHRAKQRTQGKERGDEPKEGGDE